LTGRLPYQGTATVVLAQLLTAGPPRPSSVRPDLDPSLDAVCLKAMAKAPGDRYASMAEFAESLDAVLRSPSAPRIDDPVRLTPAPGKSSPPGSALPTFNSAGLAPQSRQARRRRSFMSMILALPISRKAAARQSREGNAAGNSVRLRRFI